MPTVCKSNGSVQEVAVVVLLVVRQQRFVCQGVVDDVTRVLAATSSGGAVLRKCDVTGIFTDVIHLEGANSADGGGLLL